ncbi:molybdenum cofactor guanylyltransferase [Modestobacter sp. SYSU DS0290]
MTEPPPFAAIVLAGGRASRLGGQPKPQLDVGGRTMLAAVLAAVPDARPRIVVGPPQDVPAGVTLVREDPPGGGPVPALAAGLAAVPGDVDVVAVLAGDLPFITPQLVAELRTRLSGDGVLVVDDSGRDQLLLGLWRTGVLRAALTGARPHAPLRSVLGPLAPVRHRPRVPPGSPAPWTDCDTPAELAAARITAAGRLPGGSPG